MGYQRAQWHSGLTYRQECRECKTVFKYTDEILGFRPWFADGFVYCPKCNTPNRHNESYAIDGQQTGNVTYAHTAQIDNEGVSPATAPKAEVTAVEATTDAVTAEAEDVAAAVEEVPAEKVVDATAVQEDTEPELCAFCTKCGKKFRDGDLFCSGCGNKRA